jgi:hypothetical protein
MASTEGPRLYRQAYHQSRTCRRSVRSGVAQRSALFALLQGHVWVLSPCLCDPASRRIGCQIHAADRHVFERHRAWVWICGSRASVQALSSGHWGNAGRLATRQKGARPGHGTNRWSNSCSQPLLAADIVPLQGAAYACEQFVRSEWFYEIANRARFDCLRPRPLVRIGSHENGGYRTIRGDQMLM